MRVQRLPAGDGRDFVVGDIHGMFHLVRQALEAVSFNPQTDRLFSVGDMVDRGPFSAECLKFMAEPWVYAVQGNHEKMFLDMYADGAPSPTDLAWLVNECGQQWWLDVPEDQRWLYLSAFSKLPIAMEVQTRSGGTVGIVHAEVPRGMDWTSFVAHLDAGIQRVCQCALWGRSRCTSRDTSVVAGIDRIYCGHTVLEQPTTLGNVSFIDTGAVFTPPTGGRLTIVELSCPASQLRHRAHGPLEIFEQDTKPRTTWFNRFRLNAASVA